MNYHNITKDDMLNGDGLRTVLWVAGCTHHCHNCQNPITWDVAGGIPFDEKAEEEDGDEDKIRDVGGFWYYEGDHAISVKETRNGKDYAAGIKRT